MATTLFPLQYLRQGADPIDVDSVFATTAERIAYLANGRRYPGQVVADLEENKVYCLDNTGTSWIEVGGGGGIPGGLDGQVQFNDGGVFGGNAGFTYDSATSTVGLSKISNTAPITVEVTSTPAWYSLYGDLVADVDDDYSSSVVYDSLGNIYSIGADGNTGVPFLLKYSPSGTLIWQKTFTEVNNYYKTGDALTVDSLDNVYCSISVDDVVVESYIIKLDSSGNIVWQLKLQNFNGSDYTIPPVTDMMVDGSNNLYAIATPKKLPISWPGDAVLIKFSSGGVLQWQRKLSTPDVNDSLYPQGIWVDSAGNSHIVMTYTVTSPPYPVKTIVAKYTTGGVLDWQNEYDIATSQNDYGYNITGDSAGNIYFTSDSSSLNIIKADSSGSIIWNKQIDSGTYSSGVALDASGNVYVSGGFFAGSPSPRNDYLIVKYTSAGSLVWQRSFSGSDNDYTYYYWATRNIDVLGENYVIAGYTYTPSSTGNAEAIAVQLKTDGSGTGVYGSFTYGIPAFTESTPAITVQASTLTAAVAGLTISAGSLAAADLTKTATYTYMFGGAQTWSFNADGSLSLPGYSIPGADGVAGSLLQTDGAGTANWTPYGLPAADGSTGTALITDGAGAVDWTPYSLPTVDGAAGQILTTDGAGTTTWQNAAPTAGGNNTQVQYNSGGQLAGDTRFTYNSATNTVEFDNLSNNGDINVTLGTANPNAWTTLVSQATGYGGGYDVRGLVVDTSGNIYIAATFNTYYPDCLIKLNSSGEIIWSVDLDILIGNIAINSIGEILVVGQDWTYFDVALFRVSSSSGALISKTMISSTTSSDDGYTICVDGTDAVVAWTSYDTTYICYAVKINSAGTILWQKRFDFSTLGVAELSSINRDNLGNMYLFAYTDWTGHPTYTGNVVVIKIDSSGNILWQKKYSLDPSNQLGRRIQSTFDAANNLYWSADSYRKTPTTLSNVVVVKCDTSGNIIWQKEVSSYSTGVIPISEVYGITYDGITNSVLIIGTCYDYTSQYGQHTQIYFINASTGYMNDWASFYSNSGGSIYPGYSTYVANGPLITVSGNRFVWLCRGESGPSIYNNQTYNYDSAVISSFSLTTSVGTISSAGIVYDTDRGGVYNTDITLTTSTTTVTTTTSAFSPTVESGISYIITTWDKALNYGVYTTQFQETGNLLVSSAYYLPKTTGIYWQVLTAIDQGETTWATPAVVSRSTSYTWGGKQSFGTPTDAAGGIAASNIGLITKTSSNPVSGLYSISMYINSNTVLLCTTAATGNWSVFFTTSTSSFIAGETVECTIMVTQGATAYYNVDIWIDDVRTPVVWRTTRPVSGNPNSIDVYTYKITKLTDTPATYNVLGDVFPYVTVTYPYWVSFALGGLYTAPINFYKYSKSSIVLDSSNNVYFYMDPSGGIPSYFQKINDSGNSVFVKSLTGDIGRTYTNSYPQNVVTAIDGSGNTYTVTHTGLGPYQACIVKISSTGSVIWTKMLAATYIRVRSIAADSAGNTYLTRTDGIILKYDTAGTIIFQQQFSSSPVLSVSKVDSSGNIYVAGLSFIAKLNSSGTILWQKSISVTGSASINNMHLDGSGNLYITMGIYTTTPSGYVLKIDTATGNLLWCVTTGNRWVPVSITTDAAGGVYVGSSQTNYFGPATGIPVNYCKLNSSGALQWNNNIVGNINYGIYWPSAMLDIYYNTSNTTLYVYVVLAQNSSDQGAAIVFKMPPDGGGRNVYRYSPGYIAIVASGTMSITTSSATLSNTFLTLSASSLTDTVGTTNATDVTPDQKNIPVVPTL